MRYRCLLALRLAVLLGLCVITLGRPPLTAARGRQTVPDGFVDQFVAGVDRPTGLAFTPDGRLLITSQNGQLWVYQGGGLWPQPALDLSGVLCDNWERGLQGVVVDPGFVANHHIYLYYTFNKHGACPLADPLNPQNPVNRVARFTLPSNNVILTTTELVLIDNIPQRYGIHNGGDLHFGADGWLYVSIGDGGGAGGSHANTRLLDNLNGKILRMGTDGSIPPGNPYASVPGARRCGDPAGVPPGTEPCAEVFARGLRNPFRFAFKPGTNDFYINDVGENTWEEIDVGQSGADYGWNVREGPCAFGGGQSNCTPGTPSSYADPVYYYHHNTGCGSITGAAFVPAGVWPVEYDNAYLFGDLLCGRIARLTPTDAGYTATTLVSDLGTNSVVAMAFGSAGQAPALYYTTYLGDLYSSGEVRRVVYTGPGNHPPAAGLAAAPEYGAAPLHVDFSAESSTDPDEADTLVYDWDLGDGTLLTATASVTLTHLYPAGVYTASLRVRDNRGAASEDVLVRIDSGNTPPMPVMTRVGPDEPFAVGEVLGWEGTSTDNEDTLGLLTLTWEARLHHIDSTFPANAHFHPYLAPTVGSTITFTSPAPEDFGATALSFLELRLTATDSWGLSAVITEAVQPRRVPVALQATPPGFELLLRGHPVAPPHAATSWENWAFELAAPLQTDAAGARWGWQAWSDSGPTAMRTITTLATPSTYTALLALTDQAPVPQVFTLNPPAAQSSGAGFTLTVTGKNFASDAALLWDGVALSPTTFISSTRLQAGVGAQLMAAPGPVPVSALNPAPGGGVAEAVLFVRLWRAWLPGVFVGGP